MRPRPPGQEGAGIAWVEIAPGFDDQLLQRRQSVGFVDLRRWSARRAERRIQVHRPDHGGHHLVQLTLRHASQRGDLISGDRRVVQQPLHLAPVLAPA